MGASTLCGLFLIFPNGFLRMFVFSGCYSCITHQKPIILLRYYESWASFALMERSLRNIREARGVYKRAHSRKLEEGGQVAACMDWLKFEREEGGPEDYIAAALKVEPIIEEATAAAAAAADTRKAAVAKV